ncbi:MAG: M23 family metallopeptidase [Acidobacteriota bacterium]
MTAKARLGVLASAAILVVAASAIRWDPDSVPTSPPLPLSNGSQLFGPPIPDEFRIERLEQRFPRNSTIRDVLEGWGFTAQAVHQLLAETRKAHDLNRVMAGHRLALERLADGTFVRLEYDIDDSRYLVVTRNEDGYQGRVETRQFETVVVELGGRIRDSLWNSLISMGESGQLVMNIHELMQWDVDFTAIQPDDSFKVILEKKYYDGEFVKYGDIQAMEFVQGGKAFHAFRFDDVPGRTRYFDFNGKGVKKAFLKVPFKYDYRISSGFSYSRLHPVSKVRRPHLGIDYAAPHGTPVLASAAGRVVFAGWKGAAGKMVQVRHANGYTTSYLHLSKILVKVGQGVAQGERIGLVGSTGLATGPHLDYRIQDAKGRHLNPKKHVALPADTGVPAGQMERFKTIRDELMRRLEAIPTGPVQVDGTAFAG